VPADYPDPRQPQILDPFAGTVIPAAPLEPEADSFSPRLFRGYHNVALLLRDGRVLTGGGVNKHGPVGCEHNNLRLLYPPYLRTGVQRPEVRAPGGGALGAQPLRLALGGVLEIEFVGGPLRTGGPFTASLLSFGSFTHSFGMGQTLVPLRTLLIVASGATSGRLTLGVELSATAAVPGDYLLFIIGESGAPSEGVHLQLRSPDVSGGGDGDGDGGLPASVVALASVGGVLGGQLLVLLLWQYQRRARATANSGFPGSGGGGGVWYTHMEDGGGGEDKAVTRQSRAAGRGRNVAGVGANVDVESPLVDRKTSQRSTLEMEPASVPARNATGSSAQSSFGDTLRRLSSPMPT
jgi:hypothetical protein